MARATCPAISGSMEMVVARQLQHLVARYGGLCDADKIGDGRSDARNTPNGPDVQDRSPDRPQHGFHLISGELDRRAREKPRVALQPHAVWPFLKGAVGKSLGCLSRIAPCSAPGNIVRFRGEGFGRSGLLSTCLVDEGAQGRDEVFRSGRFGRQGFERYQSTNFLGLSRSEQGRDVGAPRAADKHETMPSEPVQQFSDLWKVVPDIVGRMGGAMVAQPLSAQIERDNTAPFQSRRQFPEALRVIHQPCRAGTGVPFSGPHASPERLSPSIIRRQF